MVGESLLASGQPISRQYKVIILSSVSLVSFCSILKASVKETRCQVRYNEMVKKFQVS